MIERGCKLLGDIALWSDLFDMGNYGPRPLDFPQPATKEYLPTKVFPLTLLNLLQIAMTTVEVQQNLLHLTAAC